jgi:hypothetical protein
VIQIIFEPYHLSGVCFSWACIEKTAGVAARSWILIDHGRGFTSILCIVSGVTTSLALHDVTRGIPTEVTSSRRSRFHLHSLHFVGNPAEHRGFIENVQIVKLRKVIDAVPKYRDSRALQFLTTV